PVGTRQLHYMPSESRFRVVSQTEPQTVNRRTTQGTSICVRGDNRRYLGVPVRPWLLLLQHSMTTNIVESRFATEHSCRWHYFPPQRCGSRGAPGHTVPTR